MVELVTLRSQIVNDVAQARTPGQLGHHQSHQLRPAARSAELATDVVAFCEGLEVMSRNQLQ